MSDDSLADLLTRGRAAARAGDHDEARFFLQWVLDRCERMCDERLEALYWMSRISQDPAEKRGMLEDILSAEPFNLRARNDLAILDGRLKPAERIDPDHIPARNPGELRSIGEDEARRFTCPQCGGKLTYTPDGQSLTCEYCESRQLLAGSRAGRWLSASEGEEDFQLSMATARGHLKPVETQAIACQACGGDFILPPEALSAICPYCGSSYVISQVSTRSLIPPSSLIPFFINAEKATAYLENWINQKGSEAGEAVPSPQGIYLPAWAFDLGGEIDWRGYRQVKKVRKAVSGREPVSISNLLIPASQRCKDGFALLLNSYQLDRRIPFDQRYLVDWPAATYDISMGDASLSARALALKQLRAELPEMQCRGVEDLVVTSAGMVVESYQLMLLPVWIGRYRENEKLREILINGQTGSVYGQIVRGRWFERLESLLE